MSYSTVNNFLVAYPKLNGLGQDLIAAFLARAAARIDSYLAGAITVPVSPAPPLLVALEEDLAYVGLLRRHSQEASKDTAIDKLEEAAIAMLEDIRDGKIALLSSAGAALAAGIGGQIWSSTEGKVPTFGVGAIEDAEVDPDRLDEEAAARK